MDSTSITILYTGFRVWPRVVNIKNKVAARRDISFQFHSSLNINVNLRDRITLYKWVHDSHSLIFYFFLSYEYLFHRKHWAYVCATTFVRFNPQIIPNGTILLLSTVRNCLQSTIIICCRFFFFFVI